MTTTWFIEPNEYWEDAAFYCDNTGNTLVGVVENDEKRASIYSVGVMRIYNHDNDDTYRTTDDLMTAGLRSDDALWRAETDGTIEFLNNPWFAVYDESDEEIEIAHSVYDALAIAEEYIEGDKC